MHLTTEQEEEEYERMVKASEKKISEMQKLRAIALNLQKENPSLKGQELKKRAMEILNNSSKPKKQSKLKTKTLSGKESTVMRAISKAHMEDDKPVISTDMNVKKGLSSKDKKALKESVMKAIDHHIKGGMIGEEEEEFEPIKPKPLVRRGQEGRQEQIEEKMEEFAENTGVNPMELLIDNWEDLDDRQAIKRYFMLYKVLEDIDPLRNPLRDRGDISTTYSRADYEDKAGMNAKEYYSRWGDYAKDVWKNDKNKIYRFLNVKEGTGFK